jgi:uncharacterized protein YprB with RNaseH-like and TPR domain
MTTLYLDIETIPAEDEKRETLAYLYERKREKARSRAGEGDGSAALDAEDFEQFLLSTSFDGAFGRILCVGYAFDDGPVEALVGDEQEMLVRFWELAQDATLFVGHNVMEFDLPFIYQRSIVHRVRPCRKLSFARYRSDPIYDTMKEWAQWGRHNVGLEHLSLALGIPTPKEGIDGSQVFEFYRAGRIEEIVAYCKRDVETTRAVYKRMRFIG